MNHPTHLTLHHTNWSRKIILLSLVASLLLPMLLLGQPAPATAQAALQPEAAAVAAAQPSAPTRILVQKAGNGRQAEQLVLRLGGTVIMDLDIINGFAASVPAAAIPTLAGSQFVRSITLDGPVTSAGKGNGSGGGSTTPLPTSTYLDTLNVRPVWNMGLKGEGIGVAVIDSGIASGLDFVNDYKLRANKQSNRILERIPFNSDLNPNDNYGHGTHVAGIIGGNGGYSDGLYAGVAPMVNLMGLNISNSSGMAYESDTVAAMQWVLENKARYNIRVVNLSVNATQRQSYHQSPMNAAAEILWFNGIVVVASAGNYDANSTFNTIEAAPANDPFIITVGASTESGTTSPVDDFVALFSARGTTTDGFVKPDIIAPGYNIISVLASNSSWGTQYPERVINGKYIRLSGTSMAAPMVTGAVALLLQDEPNLTPDQVKYRLTHSGGTIFGGLLDFRQVPYLNVYAAVTGTTTKSANTGQAASQLLWTGSTPLNWNSVNWNSANWNSVNWNSVNWNSVNWNSVNWNSVSWIN